MPIRQSAYYRDDDLRAQANAGGENYWPTYTAEICDQLGLKAVPWQRPDWLAELAQTAVLILPDLPADYLTAEEQVALREWVQAGGLLIGFATGGLDDLFGIEIEDSLPQAPDAFSLVAVLRFVEPELARPLLPPAEVDTPVPVASPVQLLRAAEDCREVLRLVSLTGEDLRRPAVTLREVGQGQALYCAFDVAHSVWAMHHGRPITGDRDGDGKLRMSDAMILQPFSTGLPYADLLVMVLRNVIARRGVPFLYALPPLPDSGAVPDALFHWGGDDEGAAGQQIPASDFMRELGLPYHFNIMPDATGKFALSQEEFARIKANGHEPSLHFNFIEGCKHPYAFTREDIHRQVGWYRQAFSETPVCSVFHWTTWTGWSEPAVWMAECGLLSDNSRIHQPSPPTNPINLVGFGFGTSYPFHFYHDWRENNQRIRFLGVPITAYEPGYWRDTEVLDTRPFQRAIDLACRWHLTMNMFFHPVCIYGFPQCREAIRWGLAALAEQGVVALHMGNDELTHWWLARSDTRLTAAEEGGVLHCEVECPWASGCVLQLYWPAEGVTVTVDGEPAEGLLREEWGGRWLYVAVPAGSHRVELK
jgi:hypothetical protein